MCAQSLSYATVKTDTFLPTKPEHALFYLLKEYLILQHQVIVFVYFVITSFYHYYVIFN